MTGKFDPAISDFIGETVSPCDTFVDVGANIGRSSFLAAQQVGQEGTVVAVEIDRRALRCLRKTVRDSADLAIEVAAMAADQLDGFAHTRTTSECGHSVLSCSASGRLVPTKALDSLLMGRGYRRVDLLKIDVEGAEFRVLRGAGGLLSRYRPHIVCELITANLAAFGHSTEDLHGFLRGIGYSFTALPGAWSPTIVCQGLGGQ